MSRKTKPVKAIKKSYRKTTKALGLSYRESKAFARELEDIGHDVIVNVATEYAIRTIDNITGFTFCVLSGIVSGVKSISNRAKVNFDIDFDIVEDYECSDCEETTDVN